MSAPDGLVRGPDGLYRCAWQGNDPLYLAYHDEEWGIPVVDDTRLFEKICLEGFQAGLSWITILRKRENFRHAFAGFDYKKIQTYNEDDIKRLLGNEGIIRHRGKIKSVIYNAFKVEEIIREYGSFAGYIWSFEPEEEERPKSFDWGSLKTLTYSPASTALSKDLKKRGWSFVGPTTCYAFMQSMGIVNDHVEGCCCREAVEIARKAFKRPERKG
jgi:DNA-3-methyladenine glycosylase I